MESDIVNYQKQYLAISWKVEEGESSFKMIYTQITRAMKNPGLLFI